jgi:hypothetical protein
MSCSLGVFRELVIPRSGAGRAYLVSKVKAQNELGAPLSPWFMPRRLEWTGG